MPLAKWPPGRESAAAEPTRRDSSARRDSTAKPMIERKGWLLKKSKTSKAWSQAAHSRRYFVSRNFIVSYFERPSSAAQGGDKLRGVIPLRDVEALRPSADPTAPSTAFDVVHQGRVYTLVPQPETQEERDAWLGSWANAVRPEAVADELRHLITEEKQLAFGRLPQVRSAAHHRHCHLLHFHFHPPQESDAQYLRLGSICGSTSTTVAGSVSGDSIPPSPAPGTAPPGSAPPTTFSSGFATVPEVVSGKLKEEMRPSGQLMSVPDLGGPQPPEPAPPPPPVATEPPAAAAKAPRRGSGFSLFGKGKEKDSPAAAPPSPYFAAPRDPGSVGKDRSSSGGAVKFRPPGAELRASGSFLEFAHPANAALVGAAKKIQRIERGRQARHDA